ncbi:MAG TPA: OmcA/MtrC family decaheme c-type cytochrome [Anaeromyxobacteraceae bacterium]|nr:OmcA/MtrC family decaheme c-type cytochrome [Anaeromyxobacteraceae bacterium]
MTLSRWKLALLAVGLLAAGTARAATVTVYAAMGGAPFAATDPLKAVGLVADTGATPVVNCRTDGPTGCVVDVTAPSIVLRASSVNNATFVAWSGCTAVAGADCTLDVTAAKTVYATFKPTSYAVLLKTYGTTDGALVTAAGSCRTGAAAPFDVCLLAVANGGALDVTAAPGAGQKVLAWSGCTVDAVDPNLCHVTALAYSKAVSATFGALDIPVTAQVQGPGTVTAAAGGAVTDGMACGNGATDCSAQVKANGTITFTATPASGMQFVGWTGCASTTATCSLTNVTAPKAITATFKVSGCNSCHGTPPASHAGLGTLACGSCHAGYGDGTVNVATHMNGTVQASNPAVLAPSTFGFDIRIVGAGYDGAAQPWVDVKATDKAGSTIALPAAITAGEFTSGTSSRIPRFTFGQLQADGSFQTVLAPVTSPATGIGSNPFAIPTTSETSKASQYVASPVTPGAYRFTFATAIQGGLDLSKTYRVVVYGARYFKPGGTQANVQYPSSDYLDFVPAGGTPVAGKETVTDAACNACHGALTLHGMRRGVAICLTCHNPNTQLGGSLVTSTLPAGRAPKAAAVWDLKNLVHRLHSGQNDVAWGTTFDASTMKMAPSHKLYFEGGSTVAGTGAPLVAVIDPELTTECTVCHQGRDAENYATKPSKAACTSCHVATDPTTGTNHDGGIATNDGTCFVCHTPSGAVTSPIYPVKAVHGRFYEPAHNLDFAALSGFPADGHKFNVTLVSVAADATGKPTFTVDVSLDGAPFDIKAVLTTPSVTAGRVATCAFQVAGPTADYVIPATGGTAVSCTTAANWTFVSSTATSSRFTYSAGTFFAGVPSGYYTAAFEIMWQRVAQASNGDYVRKPFSANPNFLLVKRSDDKTAATITDPAALALQSRRTLVEFAKCNACHEDLGFHSNRGRKGPDYCATCHNAKLDNGTRARAKVADLKAYPGLGNTTYFLPESVAMNVFIHRIHMGSDLPSVTSPTTASPWVPVAGKIAYGALRGTAAIPTAADVSDFSKFGMPNPMGRCDQCHISAGARQTWALNEGAGLAPVERTLKTCDTTVLDPADNTTLWCNVVLVPGSTTASYLPPLATGKVSTPPLKAACTSCHDSLATDVHADMNTVGPMTAGAVEHCAGCHGAGKAFDSVVVHQPIP